MSCKLHIILLRRIQNTVFYGEDNGYDKKKVLHANVVPPKLFSVTSDTLVGKEEEKHFVPLLLSLSLKKRDLFKRKGIL